MIIFLYPSKRRTRRWTYCTGCAGKPRVEMLQPFNRDTACGGVAIRHQSKCQHARPNSTPLAPSTIFREEQTMNRVRTSLVFIIRRTVTAGICAISFSGVCHAQTDTDPPGAVFVLTNQTTQNSVIAYTRSSELTGLVDARLRLSLRSKPRER
jgi:hypothetical protein